MRQEDEREGVRETVSFRVSSAFRINTKRFYVLVIYVVRGERNYIYKKEEGVP